MNTERLAKLEERTEHILNDFNGVKKDIAEVKNILYTLDDNLNNKFAAKWVEKAISWAGLLIIGAVLTALLALVVN